MSLVLFRFDYGNAALAGLPINLLSQLQAVMNAGARLIFNANRREHVTTLLRQLHWLRVPERITFKTGYTVPMRQRDCSWLPISRRETSRRLADVPGRKHLRSSASSSLAIPATRRSTISDHALIFVVAAASVWNKLPKPSPRNQICHITTCFQTSNENSYLFDCV